MCGRLVVHWWHVVHTGCFSDCDEGVTVKGLPGLPAGGRRGLGTNEERDQTLNQLLTELDGFEGRPGVLLLAATNRPEVGDLLGIFWVEQLGFTPVAWA